MASTQSQHPGYGSVAVEPPPKRPMKRWPLIALAVALMVLLGGSFAAYAYDDTRKNEIAEGITIGGVDVGGLDEDEARALLRHELIAPLQEPLVVRFRQRTFTLPGRKLRAHADLEGAIDRALEKSREGGLPGRMVRYISGGEVDEQIKPQVGYFQPAINRFVRRIARKVDRAPVDASVSPSATSLDVVPGKLGRKVRDNLLTSELNAAATRNDHRTLTAHVRELKPEVTTDEVAAAYPTYLTVSQAEYTVRLWDHLKLVKSYPIAIGQPAYPTPYGLFSVTSKQVDPVWSVPNSPWAGELAGTVVAGGTAANPLVSRWIGVTDGVGFHGTNETYSVGTAASHGCMRMYVSDIEDLYDRIDVGTPVYIG